MLIDQIKNVPHIDEKKFQQTATSAIPVVIAIIKLKYITCYIQVRSL